jgi:hypothetical protein
MNYGNVAQIVSIVMLPLFRLGILDYNDHVAYFELHKKLIWLKTHIRQHDQPPWRMNPLPNNMII